MAANEGESLKLHVLTLRNVFADGSFEVGARDNIDGFEIASNSEFGYLLPDWIDEGNKEKKTKNEGDAISETPKARKSFVRNNERERELKMNVGNGLEKNES